MAEQQVGTKPRIAVVIVGVVAVMGLAFGLVGLVSGPRDALLTWAPPALENPTIVDVVPDERTHYALNLDPEQDYIINMPDQPLPGGLSINGGHNIILIGGEIAIPWQGEDPAIPDRRMLKIQGATGVVHIEGLLGRGEDISEGIQIASPEAIIQIQNVRIENVHARDQVEFSDNHPDLIQPWGGAREIRIDGFTGTSDYQGFFLSCDVPTPEACQLGEITIKRTNIIGDPTARYLFWVTPSERGGSIVLEDVWIDVPEQRWQEAGRLAQAVWPDYRADMFGSQRATISVDDSGVEYVSWEDMAPAISGIIREGVPPDGDFVPLESVGWDYQSPGYQRPGK
jgi:hypothetical protein